nr:MAG TPA: chromosome partitioning protein [Caudoviricetes sp.]
MPKFNIDSAGDSKPRMEQRWVWLNQIEPDEFNEKIYNVSGVEALADDIKLNGLLQFPLVRYMPGGKYMIISGHRRVAAIRLLAKEDPEQWKMIPVILDPDKDDTSAHIKLISANAVNRELSQGEIMKQTLKMYSLLTEQKKKENLPGRVRDMVAKKLNMSAGAVGEYMTIEQNLIVYLKQDFLKGELSKAVAVELSKLTTADQMNWLDRIRAGEKVTADGVRQFRQQAEAKAPVNVPNVPDNVQDDVSESDTQEKQQKWTLRSGYVALPAEELTKLRELAGKYGAANLSPCQNCKLSNMCSGCCNVCQNTCGMVQRCHKAESVEGEHEESKEVPDGQEKNLPGGEKEEHSAIANVSESDTQEQPKQEHDLEWYKDMMRVAVANIAIACAKIRNYPGSESKCDYCPLYAYDHCTLTDSTPQSATYLFRARRLDDELQRLFEEA